MKLRKKKFLLITANFGFVTLASITAASIMSPTQVEKDSSLQQSKTAEKEKVFYAHRGYNSKYPENTEMSYQAAADIGFNGVETDIHLSKDNIPVILHDDTIDRTVKGGYTGAVNSFTLAELKQFDFTKGYDIEPQRILTLEEFSSKFDNQFDYFNLEIKGMTPGIEQETWNVIEKYTNDNDWMVQSFNPVNIVNFAMLNTGLRIGYLAIELGTLESTGFFDLITDLNPNYALIALQPNKYVDLLEKYNLGTSVWTVDTQFDYLALNAYAEKYGFNPDYISNYAIFNGDFAD